MLRQKSAWQAAAVVVGIPARNEAEAIGPCLDALARQQGARLDAAIICLNNTDDGSAAILRAMAPSLPFALETIEVTLPAARACAGEARRIAMDRAAQRAGPAGVLLGTDADGQVAPGWLAANLDAIGRGADAVAGKAEIEPEGARLIPPHLHEADAAECAYAALLDEIASLIDPEPVDPWPRHDEHSGASIAVTVEAYLRAGGIPPVALAEDRAFFAALARVDARIRHEPAARVVVSARIHGRAPGGMADTIRRRIVALDDLLDERLECVTDAARRARLRLRLRQAWRRRPGPNESLAADLDLPESAVAGLLRRRYFGTAWANAETASPVLRRRRVLVAELPAQTLSARRLRDHLLAARPIRRPEGQDDTQPHDAVA